MAAMTSCQLALIYVSDLPARNACCVVSMEEPMTSPATPAAAHPRNVAAPPTAKHNKTIRHTARCNVLADTHHLRNTTVEEGIVCNQHARVKRPALRGVYCCQSGSSRCTRVMASSVMSDRMGQRRRRNCSECDAPLPEYDPRPGIVGVPLAERPVWNGSGRRACRRASGSFRRGGLFHQSRASRCCRGNA